MRPSTRHERAPDRCKAEERADVRRRHLAALIPERHEGYGGDEEPGELARKIELAETLTPNAGVMAHEVGERRRPGEGDERQQRPPRREVPDRQSGESGGGKELDAL